MRVSGWVLVRAPWRALRLLLRSIVSKTGVESQSVSQSVSQAIVHLPSCLEHVVGSVVVVVVEFLFAAAVVWVCVGVGGAPIQSKEIVLVSPNRTLLICESRQEE